MKQTKKEKEVLEDLSELIKKQDDEVSESFKFDLFELTKNL